MLQNTYHITYNGPIVTSIQTTKELSETERNALLITNNLKLLEDNGIEITQQVRDAVADLIDGISSWNSIVVHSATMDMNSIGKDLNMAYSDFGVITTNYDYTMNGSHGNDTEKELYVAGYEQNKLNSKPTTDMTFTGVAVAQIQKFNSESSMLSQTNDATLTVSNSGTETLSMNFSKADNPWYDVTITKDGAFPDVEIDINDIATGNIKDDNFKATADMTNKWSGGENGSKGIVASYYGASGTATEATATSQFGLADSTYNNGMHVEAVFGGKAQ